MTKKNARTKPEPITTMAGLEMTVAEITALELEKTAAEARVTEMQADAERELADRLRVQQQDIEALGQKIKAKMAVTQVFVQMHRDELMPGKKKSFELPTAVVGFADSSKAKVVPADGSVDWESIVLRLDALDWGDPFVRVPLPEVDKDALIAKRDELTKEQLAAAGIRFEQPEKFYVKPKSQVAERVS